MGYRDVRITINGADAFVRSPYEAKDVIRDMPYRRWNPGTKVWVIPREDVDMLRMKLEEAGFTVTLVDDTETVPPRPNEPPQNDPQGAYVKMMEEVQSLKAQLQATTRRNQDLVSRNRSLESEISRLRVTASMGNLFGRGNNPFGRSGGGSWAEDMFQAMTPDQAKAAYKKLSTVLHPDLGGDVELMKLINVAYEKVNK